MTSVLSEKRIMRNFREYGQRTLAAKEAILFSLEEAIRVLELALHKEHLTLLENEMLSLNKKIVVQNNFQ